MSSLAKNVRRAALFAALEQLAKAHGCRDILSDGSSTPIDITIDARVRRAVLHEEFSGRLTVGHSYPKSKSSVCNQEHLLACCADLLGREKRARHFAEVAQYFKRKKILPPVDADVLAECNTLLSELRHSSKSETRGTVQFELDDNAEQ